MSHLIRLLTPADAPAFVALRTQALLDVPHAFTNTPEEDRSLEEIAHSLEKESGYAIIGALDGGRLVGITGVIREPWIKMAHLATIWGVYVAPEHRRRGIARAMVARAIEAARSWPGVARVRLSVSAESPEARRVYESLGFKAWGVEPDVLRVGGRSFDEVYLTLPLS
jgi:RimJ/RimL family protein N-acetyltransferase